MDEEGYVREAIKMQDLRKGEIKKTTKTEVRIDELEKQEIYSPGAKKDRSSSRGSSSEMYIIEQ